MDEDHEEGTVDVNEEKRRKAEQEAELIREYEELRKKERAEEEEEIRQMRERIEKRKQERAIEEKERLEKMRIEDEKWKQIEEERRQKKEDEEKRMKEEKTRKLKEAEEAASKKGKRNFKVVKKEKKDRKAKDVTGIGSIIAGAEDFDKSKEEMEEEKQEVLSHRIKPLEINDLDEAGLIDKLKEMHDYWTNIESEKYDNDQRFKHQQYDYMELAERARQMKMGGQKRGNLERDDDFDRENDRFQQAPPPIRLASKFESGRDLRRFEDKVHAFDKDVREEENDGEGIEENGEEEDDDGY